MGYKPQKKVYAITFEDCPGLVIRAVSAPLGKLLDLANTDIALLHRDDEARRHIFTEFTRYIVEWNLLHPDIEDATADAWCPRCELNADAPIPVDPNALLCLDLDFIVKIMMGWIEATSRVAAPKEQNSNGGEMNTPEDMQTMRLAEMQNPLISPVQS
jgi:hypothetical protein